MSKNHKRQISNLVLMGDSLSDRGTMKKRRLFGLIPMSLLAGLAGKSPQGRFTNGFAWSDYVATSMANKIIITEARRNHEFESLERDSAGLDADDIITGRYGHKKRDKSKLDDTDIADAVIFDSRFNHHIEHSYNLDDDMYIWYENRLLVRSYDEGGLTSHDYSWKPSTSISRFFSRLILPTLADKRKMIFEYDIKHDVSEAQKEQTLLVEWSGANDLITVNKTPSRKIVKRAVRDRIENARKLIENGYCNVVLVNMPDIALTPRFQNKTGEEGEESRQNAHVMSEYFNRKLQKECEKLQAQYGDKVMVEVFDLNTIFTQVINDTKSGTGKYAGKFDVDKLNTPFQDSDDFHIDDNNTSEATGYPFWDDVHPTADFHAILADEVYEIYKSKFDFVQPEAEDAKKLVSMFITEYQDKLDTLWFRLFSCKNKGNLSLRALKRERDFDAESALTRILDSALNQHNKTAFEIIKKFGWINKDKEINHCIPALLKADNELNEMSYQEMSLS